MVEKDICYVKKSVGYRIRKLREKKDLSQQNMADDLNLSLSAYNKIERGVTDTSVDRLAAIAKILKVEVVDFFQEPTTITKAEDGSKAIGYATKADIDDINHAIKKLQQEIINLKVLIPTPAPKKKKRS